MLVIISKIYFLCKNFLIGISLIKVLIFPSALIIVNQAKHSLKNNIFITNNLKGKQLKKIKYSNNFKYKREIGEIDQIMRNYGLVDIQELDSNIIVSLQYATTNNFLKKNIYGSLTHAFLQKDVAEKLINASNNLIGIITTAIKTEQNSHYDGLCFVRKEFENVSEKICVKYLEDPNKKINIQILSE